MYHKTEQEIIQNWIGGTDKPTVSICCTTYNHEKYISEALDSFFMQETDFPFEIIINDDCSTDNTANIIREYEKEYPNIIKPIYQKENQYSRNIKMNPVFNFPRAKGDYIALCEGDDFWTDPLKLQKQVKILKDHESFSMCATRYYRNKVGGDISSKTGGKYKLEDILMGNIVGTATVLFRRQYLTKSVYDFIEDKPFGDWPLFIKLAKKGDCIILDDITAVYRIHQGGVFSGIDYFEQRKMTYKSIDLYYKDQSFSKGEKSIIYKSARKELRNIFQIDVKNDQDKMIVLLNENNDFISQFERSILRMSLKINYKLFRIISRVIFVR